MHCSKALRACAQGISCLVLDRPITNFLSLLAETSAFASGGLIKDLAGQYCISRY